MQFEVANFSTNINKTILDYGTSNYVNIHLLLSLSTVVLNSRDW